MLIIFPVKIYIGNRANNKKDCNNFNKNYGYYSYGNKFHFIATFSIKPKFQAIPHNQYYFIN